ncbi:hypothetical protein GGR62_001901 [Xanthomonas campestris]|nr:hypothetical protein [Xanthomonas sp. 3075]
MGVLWECPRMALSGAPRQAACCVSALAKDNDLLRQAVWSADVAQDRVGRPGFAASSLTLDGPITRLPRSRVVPTVVSNEPR